jgi:hypothetical protein
VGAQVIFIAHAVKLTHGLCLIRKTPKHDASVQCVRWGMVKALSYPFVSGDPIV